MPHGDKTGPTGKGSMTGRGAGYCTDQDDPGFMNPVPERGVCGPGWRGGVGRGRRNRFYETGPYGRQRGRWSGPAFGGANADRPDSAVTKEQKLDALNAQAEYLQDALDSVRKRIAELKDESGAATE
jgi:hypothetical protein